MTTKPDTRTTDPYGSLSFAVGTGDDFWCFDFAVHDDSTVTLHAVINSETGSFIQDAEPPIRVPFSEAVAEAQRLVRAALDWASDNEIRRLDMKGWNQDPAFFVRSVRASITPGASRPKSRRHDWRADLTEA